MYLQNYWRSKPYFIFPNTIRVAFALGLTSYNFKRVALKQVSVSFFAAFEFIESNEVEIL
jgi:hypothetical protein